MGKDLTYHPPPFPHLFPHLLPQLPHLSLKYVYPLCSFPSPPHFSSPQAQIRRLIAFGVATESRLLRCAVARVCARAAGLSGGMGMFLSQPLLEHLQFILKNSTATSGATASAAAGVGGAGSTAAAGGGGGVTLSESRRVLEVLVPLSAKPAMKAGLVELKAVSTLSRLLHRLVNR